MSIKDIEKNSNPQFAIVDVRGVRVVIDRDVARLLGTEVRKLNQQVARSKERFSDEFAFKITWEELDKLRSQNVIFGDEWAKAKYPPTAFTEYGVVMAATVIKSSKALEATKLVVRTFVDMRRAAWEKEALKANGSQPSLSLDAPARQGLATKLNIALGHVLDAIVDPEDGTTVRDEAKTIAAEGLRSLKEYLKKAGINNEKTLAEVRRLMAEAENIEVEAVRKRTENQHRQLALLAKKLRLVIQAQHDAETGSIEGLMSVLSDLEKE